MKKISRFSRCALRPALGAILRDIGGKIAGISQCLALGTPLSLDPDQDRCSVGPDLGPNCLQRLSADDKSPLTRKELNGMSLIIYFLSDRAWST